MLRSLALFPLFLAAYSADAGPITASVDCYLDCSGLNYYATGNYAEYYTGSGPSGRYGNGPGHPYAIADASFPHPMVYPDWLDPTPRVSGWAAPGFYAVASVEGTFALTITRDDGSPGFYLPCMTAHNSATGMFAGVTVGMRLGPSDSCSYFPPMRAVPFESGVMQFVDGRFWAEASGGTGSDVSFYSMKIFDQDHNLVAWDAASMKLEYVPEPTTLTTLALGLAALAAAAIRRRPA